MKFTIEIETDNPAFFDNETDEFAPFAEIKRILLDLPSYRFPSSRSLRLSAELKDIEGYTVGFWKLDGEEDAS